MERIHIWVVFAIVAGVFLIPTPAVAETTSYSVQQSTGASIQDGTTDIGNHCDDCVTWVNFPFTVKLFDSSYSGAWVSSNGNLQFTTASASYSNSSLPTVQFEPAVLPYWDDLRTDGTGEGIFTATYSSSPFRRFVIEWRVQEFSSPALHDFEIIFFESSDQISFIYGAPVGSGASATVGVQDSSAGPATQFSSDNPTISSGLRLNFIPSTTPDNCTVRGTTGPDTLYGTSGDDVICGYGGNDKIYASGSNDTIVGGAGVDTLTYINSPAAVNVDLYAGTGIGWGTDSISEVENVTGSKYADDLGGDAANNVLGGWQGNDKIAGKEGADTENGGPGNDTLFVKTGNDILDGMTGTDTVSYVGSAVPVTVNLGAGTSTGTGFVSIVNVERVAGSKYGDTITGSNLANLLAGAAGNDRINAVDGISGNDKVDGGSGTDTCSADPGDTKVNCP